MLIKHSQWNVWFNFTVTNLLVKLQKLDVKCFSNMLRLFISIFTKNCTPSMWCILHHQRDGAFYKYRRINWDKKILLARNFPFDKPTWKIYKTREDIGSQYEELCRHLRVNASVYHETATPFHGQTRALISYNILWS